MKTQSYSAPSAASIKVEHSSVEVMKNKQFKATALKVQHKKSEVQKTEKKLKHDCKQPKKQLVAKVAGKYHLVEKQVKEPSNTAEQQWLVFKETNKQAEQKHGEQEQLTTAKNAEEHQRKASKKTS